MSVLDLGAPVQPVLLDSALSAAHHMTNHWKGIGHYSSFHRSGSEVLWDQVKYACHCYFLIEAQRRIARRLNLIAVIRKFSRGPRQKDKQYECLSLMKGSHYCR